MPLSADVILTDYSALQESVADRPASLDCAGRMKAASRRAQHTACVQVPSSSVLPAPFSLLLEYGKGMHTKGKEPWIFQRLTSLQPGCWSAFPISS